MSSYEDNIEMFTAHPLGRTVSQSSAYMFDLQKAGLSSKKYPIAPDGEIPNSAIRRLFFPITKDKPEAADSFPKLRASYALPDIGALLDQGVTEEEILAEFGKRPAEVPPLQEENAKPSETDDKRQKVLNETAEAQKEDGESKEKARRQINLRTLPPPAGLPALDSDVKLPKIVTFEPKLSESPKEADFLSVPSTASSGISISKLTEEPLEAPKSQDTKRKTKTKKSIEKKVKKGSKRPKAGVKKEEVKEAAVVPPSREVSQDAVKDLRELSSGKPRPQKGRPESKKLKVDSEDKQPPSERKDEFQVNLLKEIMSENWFSLRNVQEEKRAVSLALTQLMDGSKVAGDHQQMCRRILDIKKLLDLEPDLEAELVGILKKQLNDIIDACLAITTSDRPHSGNRQKLFRAKGADIIELLGDLGYDFPDLAEKWASLQEAIVLSMKPVSQSKPELISDSDIVSKLLVVKSETSGSDEKDEGPLMDDNSHLVHSELNLGAVSNDLKVDVHVREVKKDVEQDIETQAKSTCDANIDVDARKSELSAGKKVPIHLSTVQDSGYGSLQQTRESTVVSHLKDFHELPESLTGPPSVKKTMSSQSDSGISADVGSEDNSSSADFFLAPQPKPQLEVLAEESQTNSENAWASSQSQKATTASLGNGEALRELSDLGSEAASTLGEVSISQRSLLPQVVEITRPLSACYERRSALSSRRSSVHSLLQSYGDSSPSLIQQDIIDVPYNSKLLTNDGITLPDISHFAKKHNVGKHTMHDILDDYRLVRMLQNLPSLVRYQSELESIKQTPYFLRVVEKLPPIHPGHKEFLPGNDNTIFEPSSAAQKESMRKGRKAVVLALERNVVTEYTDAYMRRELDSQKRVTIVTPDSQSPMHKTTKSKPFSFSTRSRTEPRMFSSGMSRPSYVSSADWTRLSGQGHANSVLPDSMRQSLAWPDHCRMDQLAKRGLHKPGISISKHLDRYTLIETVNRGVSHSMRLQSQLHSPRAPVEGFV